MLLKNVPKSMAPWQGHIIPPVWQTLTSSANRYVSEVVNSGDGDDAEDACDSDGEVIGFENLVFAIFDIVHALLEAPRYREAVRGGLRDLIYYIVLYMQITEDQVSPDSRVDRFAFRKKCVNGFSSY